MIIKVLINYFIMLGLYIFFPILGCIYINLSFMYLLKKDKKSIKYYIFSLIFFLFSLYLLINPINDGIVHNVIVFKTSEIYFIFFSKDAFILIILILLRFLLNMVLHTLQLLLRQLYDLK